MRKRKNYCIHAKQNLRVLNKMTEIYLSRGYDVEAERMRRFAKEAEEKTE